MEYIRYIELDYGTNKSILNISMTSIEQHLPFIYLSFLLISQLTRSMNDIPYNLQNSPNDLDL